MVKGSQSLLRNINKSFQENRYLKLDRTSLHSFLVLHIHHFLLCCHSLSIFNGIKIELKCIPKERLMEAIVMELK